MEDLARLDIRCVEASVIGSGVVVVPFRVRISARGFDWFLRISGRLFVYARGNRCFGPTFLIDLAPVGRFIRRAHVK